MCAIIVSQSHQLNQRKTEGSRKYITKKKMKQRRAHDVFESIEKRLTVLSEFGDDSIIVTKKNKN